MKMTALALKIPIFVMSYNDMLSLRLCLRALVRRTIYAHSIIVVDNGSTDQALLRYLRKLSGLTKIFVYQNLLNLWVLGVNKAVTDWSKASGNDDRFVLTDCDIIPPTPVDGQCWLTRMQALMDTHACVGKLGLSLDLGYIKTREKFRHTYEREKFFMQGPCIGEMVIAPVDTTLALYRNQCLYRRGLGLYQPIKGCIVLIIIVVVPLRVFRQSIYLGGFMTCALKPMSLQSCVVSELWVRLSCLPSIKLLPFTRNYFIHVLGRLRVFFGGL
jgi:glycosyltransferase involved in cell wall biosynthesis